MRSAPTSLVLRRDSWVNLTSLGINAASPGDSKLRLGIALNEVSQLLILRRVYKSIKEHCHHTLGLLHIESLTQLPHEEECAGVLSECFCPLKHSKCIVLGLDVIEAEY